VAAHAGEVRVNVGGEPDRDDFGLPPVDIEIPDDARELDRDVQAYRRELRAQRRQLRVGRLHAPLSRDGLVLPLLAGCLAMVLISGVLLTVFSASQGGAPRPPASAKTPQASIGPGPARSQAGLASAALPTGQVIIANESVPISTLSSAVLALVPPGCQCRAALRRLGRQATAAGVDFYLVGSSADMPQVLRLALAAQPAAQVAEDAGQLIATKYRARGLTAVLVDADGSATLTVRHLTARKAAPGSRLTDLIPSLVSGGP
jgi:hypothetical protein